MHFPRTARVIHQNRRELVGNSLRSDKGSKLRLLVADYLEPRLICFRRRAMACDFEFRFADSYRARVNSIQSALDLINKLEEQMSVFRDNSVISHINRRAYLEPIEIEPQLFGLLQAAVRLSHKTKQAFDITSGTYSRYWEFLRRTGQQPLPKEIEFLKSHVGSHFLKLNAQTQTVRLGKKEVELNLGGIGKGYALDRAAGHLKKAGVYHAHIHAGFSSIYAMGNHPSGLNEGWPVAIRDPLRTKRDFAVLNLVNSGLGISGLHEQSYIIDGKFYGHIINPKSGYPSVGKLLALATAPSAAEADALSTAFFVMTLKEIRLFCEEHPTVGALILERNERTSYDLHCFGPIQNWLELKGSLKKEK